MRKDRPCLVQQLHDNDPDRRSKFFQKLPIVVEEDNSILDKAPWTDGAIFKLNEHINRHNSIYWVPENAGIDFESVFNVPGISVWMGLSS